MDDALGVEGTVRTGLELISDINEVDAVLAKVLLVR
jgi:hypothetical protein